jgi:eukaryotic-like serine/threonine-protein kinase
MTGDPRDPATTHEARPPSTRVTPPTDPNLPTDQTSPCLEPTRIGPTSVDLLPPGCMPVPGQTLGDFKILEILGAGAFGTVYLAQQVSLRRLVALKVVTTQDTEAQTLARLEHQHIVHVFFETVDVEHGLRLLPMQFVPGTDLEHVMRELALLDPATWSGQAILDIIDRLSRHEAMFDPSALRDRERLADSNFVEAVCWLGARLAEALAHAHSRGVLHRDVKPANILLNRYGRPLLSDFNLAFQSESDSEGHFGGTLRYMAPEHLDAFNPCSPVDRTAVDERSDLYALGVVLYEFLTGKPFLEGMPAGALHSGVLDDMANKRRARAPSPRVLRPEIPEVVDRVIRRCLDPDPARRYQKAKELVEALDGCRQLERMERTFPAPLTVTRLSARYPGLMITALALLPHIAGSIVNITYNTLSIVGSLTPAQETAFGHVLLGYNLLVYPVLVGLWCRTIVPVFRLRHKLSGPDPVDPQEVARLRRQCLTLPGLLIVLSCVGWLPGGLLFPLGIDLLAGPVSAEVFGHFLVSFTISGLIAMTYSYFGTQFLVLRILYPRLWADPQRPRQQARQELHSLEGRLRLFQLLAGLIPLSGAMLILGVSAPERFTLAFRLLVVGLIGLGMAGFATALLVSLRLTRTLSVLVGETAPVAVALER